MPTNSISANEQNINNKFAIKWLMSRTGRSLRHDNSFQHVDNSKNSRSGSHMQKATQASQNSFFSLIDDLKK